MASINIDSIMSKVRSYTSSYDGKKRMRECIDEYRFHNIRLTRGDCRVLTIEEMCEAARKLIQILQAKARESNLPQSVLNHFDSLDYTPPKPYAPGGEIDSYRIDIYFKDDLSRMSLLIVSGEKRGQRTGEGIDDIVSLFNYGYKASKRVYGSWDGHEADGAGLEIASLEQRDAGLFLEKAVEEFNVSLGDWYDATAVIVP